MVEAAETRERNEIEAQALALLTGKNYSALEELAAKHRASKDQYASGFWKLALVYNGFEPSDEAPDSNWQTRLNQIQAWIDAKPESVTARIALARLLTSYGWKARSSNYADKVTEEGWKIFAERLQRALAGLEQAGRLKDSCPVYGSTLQRIALGLEFDRARYDKIFAQAIQDHPDYEYYYNARATYLLPRWNGRRGELAKDLAKSADRIGGEAGDMLYARVVWDLNHYGGSQNVFDENKLSWKRTARGFAIILKQFPDSLAAKTEYAYLASLVGDKAKARAAFLLAQGQVDLSQWDSNSSLKKSKLV